MACCIDNRTGFHRLGWCYLDDIDRAEHTVCAKMSEAFLAFSKKAGNDLATPRPEFDFPGLQPGDYWCVCASRWLEALYEGAAPLIKLEATHVSLLDHVPIEQLKMYAESAV